MNVDELRPALATPFPAVVLEIAHQFLLLRVDRYNRFVRRQERRRLRVDVLKLRVAIDVLAAFSCLVVRLQAVAHAAQKLADNRRANLMTLLRQLGHEVTQAAGRPQQWLHRIAPRHRFDQALEIGREGWIPGRLLLAPAARLTDTSSRNRHVVANVRKSVINRRPRQSADAGHQADPAVSQRFRLQRDKAPEALFIQNRGHLPIALPRGARLSGSNHPTTLRRATHHCESRAKILAICGNYDSVVYGRALTCAFSKTIGYAHARGRSIGPS